jgi:glycosyl transferase family 25
VRGELERAALPFEVFVSQRPGDPGGFASIGFRGCFESHLRALRAARDAGVDVAVLVEDDVVVASRFLELLPEIQRELDGRSWSILLLGYLGDQSPARHIPLEPVTAHLARARHWELTGSHFVAINGAVLDELIADFERRLLPGGHRISVDGVYNEFRHHRGDDTLVCVPNLAHQAPSPSGTATHVGLRAGVLRVPAVQRTMLAAKRAVWDAEAMLPSSVSLRAWNLRARLTASKAAQYVVPATDR